MTNSISRTLVLISAALSIVLLGGCQENSDGSSSGDERMIQITHENAREISSRSLKSSTSSTGALDQESSSGRSISSRLESVSPRASSQSTTTQNNTAPCDNGGTITILSVDDLDGDGEIDAFEAQMDNCKSDNNIEINGDLSLKAADTNSSIEIILTSKRLSITDQGETTTLEDMHIAMTESKTSYAFDFDTNLITSEGEIIIETDPAFKGRSSNGTNPDTGKMTIKGANSSFISIDADTGSNKTVQLTVNDGTSTQSETVRWDELTSGGTSSGGTSSGGTSSSGTSSSGNNYDPGMMPFGISYYGDI